MPLPVTKDWWENFSHLSKDLKKARKVGVAILSQSCCGTCGSLLLKSGFINGVPFWSPWRTLGTTPSCRLERRSAPGTSSSFSFPEPMHLVVNIHLHLVAGLPTESNGWMVRRGEFPLLVNWPKVENHPVVSQRRSCLQTTWEFADSLSSFRTFDWNGQAYDACYYSMWWWTKKNPIDIPSIFRHQHLWNQVFYAYPYTLWWSPFLFPFALSLLREPLPCKVLAETALAIKVGHMVQLFRVLFIFFI